MQFCTTVICVLHSQASMKAVASSFLYSYSKWVSPYLKPGQQSSFLLRIGHLVTDDVLGIIHTPPQDCTTF